MSVHGEAPVNATLGPVLAQALAYLTALTGEEDPVVTFQAFSDRKPSPAPAGWRDPLARVLHGTLKQHAAELARLNDAGAGIFIMVNAGDLRGRQEKNVVAVRAFFTDEDKPAERPEALAPSFIVRTSAEKRHVYWRIRGVVPLQEFRGVQKRLIAYYGSDPAVHELPRVMRVPGFYHRKAEPLLVTFEMRSGLGYTLGQILAAHPLVFRPKAALPSLPPRETSSSTDEGEIIRERVLDVADRHSWAVNDRHASGKAVAAYARKLDLAEGEILSIVIDRLVAAGKDEEEARDIVAWTMANVAPIPGDRERVVRAELGRRRLRGIA